MNKGLKVTEGFYLNLDNICQWHKDQNSITIINSSLDEFCLIEIYVKGTQSSHDKTHGVELNEFKRIEREISNYFGV